MDNNLEFVLDFSQNDYDDLDDSLGQLIRAALNQKNIKENTNSIPEKLKTIKENILYIAEQNQAKVTIKADCSSKIIIELESDVIDFDNYELRKLFADIIKSSKFVSIESRTDGKCAVIIELI